MIPFFLWVGNSSVGMSVLLRFPRLKTNNIIIFYLTSSYYHFCAI